MAGPTNRQDQTACGCIDLKTGSFIIGYINLAADVIGALVLIGLLVALGQSEPTTQDEKDVKLLLQISFIILVCVFLLVLIFAIVLVVGLHKGSPGHLKAYMIFSYIYLTLSIIGLFLSIANTTFLIFSRDLLVILWHINCLIVIRNMHKQMTEEAESRAASVPAAPCSLYAAPNHSAPAVYTDQPTCPTLYPSQYPGQQLHSETPPPQYNLNKV